MSDTAQGDFSPTRPFAPHFKCVDKPRLSIFTTCCLIEGCENRPPWVFQHTPSLTSANRPREKTLYRGRGSDRPLAAVLFPAIQPDCQGAIRSQGTATRQEADESSQRNKLQPLGIGGKSTDLLYLYSCSLMWSIVHTHKLWGTAFTHPPGVVRRADRADLLREICQPRFVPLGLERVPSWYGPKPLRAATHCFRAKAISATQPRNESLASALFLVVHSRNCTDFVHRWCYLRRICWRTFMRGRIGCVSCHLPCCFGQSLCRLQSVLNVPPISS